MSDKKHNLTTLKNGLRVVTVPQKDSLSATVMMLVGVGSRHEESTQSGIAHFIEHNVFKGTEKRNKRNQIAEEIEGLGGVTNAATSQELTYYWAKAASTRVGEVLDVVLDIATNMTFPEEDMEIERGNVIEEINMYQDNPMQRMMRDYIEFVWGGHPVGRRIIGTKETVGSLNRQQMLDFVSKNYFPENMLLIVAGGIEPDAIHKQLESFYDGLAVPEKSEINQTVFEEFQTEPRVYIDKEPTQQTHLCIGFKSFGRNDKRRARLDLVNAVLGQGMSSRLFRKIREELGLAYYVGSSNWEYDETGLWFVQAGVDNQRVDQAITAIMDEFEVLANELVDEAELRKAKEFVKGKTLLGVETSDELGSWYGFQELLEDEVLTPTEYSDRIESVTSAELRDLVNELIVSERVNLGVIGPNEGAESLEKLISRF